MQNTRNFSIGQGIGSALGGIAGLFGIGIPNTGKANNYLAQMQPSIDRYLQPYIGAGHNAMGTVQGQYGDLLNNPGDMLSKMGSGYQQSPGYQYNVDQMTKAANNAAAAGGYIGSPQQQEYMAKQIGGLANQDYNQYLNNVMGLYGQGLQGMGNINQMGFQASGMANQTLSDMLKAQAQLAYADAMNKANSQSSGFGGLLGGVGKVIGGLLF